MKLVTDAIFTSGRLRGFFDPRYTCDQDNSSPELRWSEEPEGTLGFALVAEDLSNAQTLWVVYQIPATVHHLPAGIPPQDALPNGIRQGMNDQRKLGYSGPCPPSGEAPHRFRFRLFALGNLRAEIPARATAQQLLATLNGSILAEAQVEGHYQRMLRETA